MDLLKVCTDASYGAKSVAYTGTAGTTGSWPTGPQGVWVWSTTDAFIRVGEGVTATTADTPLPANRPVAFAVSNPTGGPWVVSAVQVSAGGTLYAKPMNIQ
jgi:hypothetical protein